MFSHLRITPGSVCISYLVPYSAIADITSAVNSKSDTMREVGVFYFSINGKVLLDEKDDVNFNELLFEAEKLGEKFESSMLQSLAASPSVPQQAIVRVPKSLLQEFNSIRSSFGRMMNHVSKIIKQNSPPLDDLKSLIQDCYPGRSLKVKLDECSDISGVLLVIKDECSLTDIGLLQTVVEEFEVTEAEKHIEQYKTTLKEFCHSMSIRLSLKGRSDMTTPYLAIETATYVFDWEPQELMLRDIVDILSEIAGQFVKIVCA
ncbi:PREDICTED: uncharacterized protein LOC109589425 [Amphimedon queenslandica]|uniref:Uncharacterized protein n=1 Tax=Amphimedon queenslandica TaxID=400682 RepID=A0A1X7T758_AMPQE|nr:PREDICTED: uncharacterized protein LOC109589425 [Amphimedon queenslandica]|eukprot:XP_019861074.1 PREDICTED: uncharacterized protein LOC109589425 [Amphimedon queenslandica]